MNKESTHPQKHRHPGGAGVAVTQPHPLALWRAQPPPPTPVFKPPSRIRSHPPINGLGDFVRALFLFAVFAGLATGRKRPQALELLEKRQAEEPGDADARTLHGIILSWDGRYDEARRNLEAVLARHRDYGDALRALINVEMWSDHPGRAEALARDTLRRNPNDTALLLARAKALGALGQSREALATVRHLIDVDPGNQEAASQEPGLGDSLRHWTASFGRAPWREEQVQLSRQTGLGSVIARFSQAGRFSIVSQQVEIDAYPHIRPGTYAYLNVGYSSDAAVYSRYHFAAGSAGYLIAASYGAVYGMLSGNGRVLYVADGVNHRRYLFDLGGSRAEERPVSDALRREQDERIRSAILSINRFYHFREAGEVRHE